MAVKSARGREVDVSLQPFGHKLVAGVNVDGFQQLRSEVAEFMRRERRYEQDLASVRLDHFSATVNSALPERMMNVSG